MHRLALDIARPELLWKTHKQYMTRPDSESDSANCTPSCGYLWKEAQCQITLLLQFYDSCIYVALCKSIRFQNPSDPILLRSSKCLNWNCLPSFWLIWKRLNWYYPLLFKKDGWASMRRSWVQHQLSKGSCRLDYCKAKVLISHLSAAMPACWPMLDAQDVILSLYTFAH